jgi:diketogulonate reductase-like aldo/keto reductase
MAVWSALEAIVDTGGARQLGISNCYAPERLAAIYRKARIKPAVVQNRFYAETGYDLDIRAFCQAHGIVYQSFWTLTANPRILAHPVTTALAAKFRRTPAQVLFRFLTQADIVPLTGTTSAEHMRDDLAIFEFELAPGEREAIKALLS